ncbi:unnamed protein product, partial [Choristocarpus tenellus]
MLLFGSELFGTNKAITQRMQVFVNRSLLTMADLRALTGSNVALWRDMGIPPVCARAVAQQAWALNKCFTLSTWIRTMVETPFQHRCWTWVTGTHRWMNRYM